MDLRISLVGHLRIEADGAVVAGEKLGSMAKVRDALAAAGLRRHDVLENGPGWYQLCLPEGVAVDVEEAGWSLRDAGEALRTARQHGGGQAERARDAAAAALAVAARPFLVGSGGTWVERRQIELTETRAQALEALAEALFLAGDPAAAVARAEEATGLEPLRETAHVALMAALGAARGCAAGLRALAEAPGRGAGSRPVAPDRGRLPRPARNRTADSPADGPTDKPVDTPNGPSPGPASRHGVTLLVARTSFVGRQAELVAARGLMNRTPLLTITGPGGVGKSRLALHLAGQWADGDEVALVELAPLADQQRVRHRVAEVFGLAEDPRGKVVHRLVAHLAPRRLLFVLDNCEHLVGACAALADALAALGSLALHQGDRAEARRSHKESLALRRELCDRAGELESRHLRDVARMGQEMIKARGRYQESLEIALDLGDTCRITRARLVLAKVARAERAGAEVQVLLDQAIPDGSQPAPDALLAEWLEGVGGAADALRDVLGVPVPDGERASCDADVVRRRQALGERRWDAAVNAGRALPPEATATEARRCLPLAVGG